MEYAHEEVLRELGITKSDLPKDLSVRIGAWSNKRRLSNSPVKVEEVRVQSEDLADDITAWHYANSDDDEEEEEEEEEDYTPPTPPVAPVVNTPPAAPTVVEDEEKKDSGWGLGFLSNW